MADIFIAKDHPFGRIKINLSKLFLFALNSALVALIVSVSGRPSESTHLHLHMLNVND